MNIFDILGPIMVGPSSSHTAGAVRIGYLCRTLFGEPVVEAFIGLHGSFAATGAGHGTDRAILAGLLGMKPDDLRIPDSFEIAESRGVRFDIHPVSIPEAHPNTAVLEVTGESGKKFSMTACSVGGGRVEIRRLGNIDVHCTAEKPTLILKYEDRRGVAAAVTTILAESMINIATMNLYREKKGGTAVMVLEADQQIPEEVSERIAALQGVHGMNCLRGESV